MVVIILKLWIQVSSNLGGICLFIIEVVRSRAHVVMRREGVCLLLLINVINKVLDFIKIVSY